MILTSQQWSAFQSINRSRRSVRDFEDIEIPDQDISDILTECLYAPSSANTQPFEIHWIKDQELKKKAAKACNAQRAATQANNLFVLVASTDIIRKTMNSYSDHIEQTTELSERSKAYHFNIIRKIRIFLKIAPLIIWTPIIGFISWFFPSVSIQPFGALGVRNWAAKNSIFAAQTLLLASVAKGYDACPMEGFNPVKLASLLKLPYGSVIVMVIALGKKSPDARIEPQWRKDFNECVKIY